MPSLFSRLKNKDGSKSKKKGADLDSFTEQLPKGPQWTDAWTRTTVEPEEVVELITLSTEELKSRGMTSIWTPRVHCLAYPAPTLCACACHRTSGGLCVSCASRLLSESIANNFSICSSRYPIFTAPFPTDLRPQRRSHLCATLFRQTQWRTSNSRRGTPAGAAHDRAHGALSRKDNTSRNNTC